MNETRSPLWSDGGESGITTPELVLDVIFVSILVYCTACELVVLAVKRYSMDVVQSPGFPSLINWIMVVSGLIGTSAVILNIFSYFREYHPITFSIKGGLTVLSITAVYLVLWLRQRMFYTTPVLKHLASPFTRGLSNFEGCFIVLGSLLVVIIIAHQSLANHCDLLKCIPNWVFILAIVTQCEVEITVLVLFIYPLLKHKRQLRDGAHDSNPSYLMALMKRTIALTVVAVVTDFVSLTVFLLTKNGTIYNFDVVLNLVCIKMCFVDWRDRFLPCNMCACETTRPVVAV